MALKAEPSCNQFDLPYPLETPRYRQRDSIEDGQPETQYLQAGDRVEIAVHDLDGQNLFGTIAQEVVAP